MIKWLQTAAMGIYFAVDENNNVLTNTGLQQRADGKWWVHWDVDHKVIAGPFESLEAGKAAYIIIGNYSKG